MAKCFSACGCDDDDRITKADVDRYTDKIENILNDEKGRKLFRNFMYTAKLKDGRRALDVWERIDKLLSNKDNNDMSHHYYIKNVEWLMDKAERVEELDYNTIMKLSDALDSENQEEIHEILTVLKVQITKILRREYDAFKSRFVPPPSQTTASGSSGPSTSF